MKQITNKTIIKQWDKTFQPIEVDGVVYWIDITFKESENLKRGNGILFTKENGEREVYTYDEHDGYGLGVFDLQKQRCTIRQSAWCLIVAQSQATLYKVPIINLDSYVERLAEKDSPYASKAFERGFKSNLNQYTQKDIKKAVELARVENIEGRESCDSYYSIIEILEQINSISVIEVDEHFNIINYE